MFTGIIEEVGKILNVSTHGSNKEFQIVSAFAGDLKVDESVSHNGVCLTVTASNSNDYTVVAIKETLDKSNLGGLKVDQKINLERAMQLGSRIDGHLVQGHVDATLTYLGIEEENGSHVFWFELPKEQEKLVVLKGSICLNGVSLTIANIEENRFSVAIIPFTFEHTTFSVLQLGDSVNVEFDILGKYVQRMLEK